MSRTQEIKDGIIETKIAREVMGLKEYDEVIDDFEYLLNKLETAEKGLEQIKKYIDCERYTKAWKETIGTLDQLRESRT